jgi:Spy/CpxP family protein refolding chaperone
MKSNRLLAIGVLLLSVTSVAVPALAGDAGKNCDARHHTRWAGHENFGGRDFRHLGKALDLTDAQKETLKAQRETDKAAREALFAKLADARQSLATAVNAGANDAELNALADTLGKLHAEQALAGAKAHQAFLATLTAEQKQTLAELKTKRLEHKHKHRSADESTES